MNATCVKCNINWKWILLWCPWLLLLCLDPNARIIATPPLWEIKCSTYVGGIITFFFSHNLVNCWRKKNGDFRKWRMLLYEICSLLLYWDQLPRWKFWSCCNSKRINILGKDWWKTQRLWWVRIVEWMGKELIVKKKEFAIVITWFDKVEH